LDDNESLKANFKVNSPENAKLSFDGITSDIMQNLMEINFSFYKQFADDDEF